MRWVGIIISPLASLTKVNIPPKAKVLPRIVVKVLAINHKRVIRNLCAEKSWEVSDGY